MIAAEQCKFSVSKLAKFAKNGRFADRIGAGVPVYLAAVLEYIVCEILELAELKMKEEKTKKNKSSRITPRHLMLAIQTDPELSRFITGTICCAGVVPLKFDEGKRKK